ncbi:MULTISPECIES: TetR/AcrR family transcriptional regulator [Pseudonocardia]|uniref:Regulatory protein TetR n=1 Tax=Pseudonocardia dioxanivorans (strain ATCC 55486 / DSM 44775 / JCM 13855 / CB1190) TaxID=675635 RepID=F4D0G5_PSEUX|nr:TetR family transcriptional regulator C-terminal domain-containing protein [Pseudonocardia dioxanivorans]AEA26761.1 regulatory protein TetR [Pseudonocardia dioxanivorans CB1190]GJF04799.1 TetR family transcriptional regulator [Pseudonocardia sp. D17]
MPKVVDAEQRRREVFDAVFTVVVEHGVHGASLRRVAETAGLAIGSVRHYFDSAEQMLTEAAAEVIARVTTRLEAHRAELDAETDRGVVAERMIAELLPWDAVSTRETTVWLEFALAARTAPAYRATAELLHAGVRELARRIVENRVPPERTAVEAERLACLIDGLGFAGTLHPGSLPPGLARDVVRRHLDSLGA